jgi:predicted nucleic acid-binding protein
MTSLIVDASVALKWLVEEEKSDAAIALLRRDDDIIAPSLVLAEIGSALWKKYRLGQLSVEPELALREAANAFSELVELEVLASRALALALSLEHPIYDCFYLALTEARAGTLVTADARLIARLSQVGWSSSFEAL